MRTVAAALLTVLLAGCGPAFLSPRIDVPLALRAVQRPADVAERWGSYALTPADTSGYTYEDGLVSLTVASRGGWFSVTVANRTEHTIRLLWTESSYVGPSGLASNVLPAVPGHAGSTDVPGPQNIPARSVAVFGVIPRTSIDESETRSFYDEVGMECPEILDSSIRLILTFAIAGASNEYTLVFTPREGEVAIVQREQDPISGLVRETPFPWCE